VNEWQIVHTDGCFFAFCRKQFTKTELIAEVAIAENLAVPMHPKCARLYVTHRQCLANSHWN
jgi:hypothetical protein